jgi:CsoR family transcriptional regulator, copper-sensing transcriptional repressor
MACKPDHTPQIKRLNRMIGQLGGIKKMIEDGVYCPEILIQTKAVSSALRSLETCLLEGHLNGCVTEAITTGHDKDKKVEELLQIFKTRIK